MSQSPNGRITPSLNGRGAAIEPDPQAVPKAERRHFSAEYKTQILAEADACTERGQVGALLRREGLYSSHLDKWRKQRARGQLAPGAQLAPLVQVRRVQTFPAQQRPDLAALGTGIGFCQNVRFVCGAEVPSFGLRHHLRVRLDGCHATVDARLISSIFRL